MYYGWPPREGGAPALVVSRWTLHTLLTGPRNRSLRHIEYPEYHIESAVVRIGISYLIHDRSSVSRSDIGGSGRMDPPRSLVPLMTDTWTCRGPLGRSEIPHPNQLGGGTVGRISRVPFPNPQVTLFIRDRLKGVKALKAVHAFEHSSRATPCRKLERWHRR